MTSVNPLQLKLNTIRDLPAHPELASLQANATQAAQFARSALEKAPELVDVTISKWPKQHGTKASPPASAKVETFSGHAIEGVSEEWFGRRSIHKNEDVSGTATWTQFDESLRKGHSQHEGDYTPNIFDANWILSWEIDQLSDDVTGVFREISMSLWEMYHQIPFPVSNRVFHTLVITSKYDEHGFIVIQLPVDITDFPPQVLERSHYDMQKKKYRTREADGTWKLTSSLVTGKYVSVERVKFDGENITWEMATASDAGGRIPQFVNDKALPGEVAKDVGYVMGWIDKNRKKPQTE